MTPSLLQSMTPGLDPAVLQMLLSQPTHAAQAGQLDELRKASPFHQADPRTMMLRDWHHQAFARQIMEMMQGDPTHMLGRLLAALGILGWQGSKVGAQYMPGGSSLSNMLPLGIQPHLGTAPSFGQIPTGLGPIFRGLPTPGQVPFPSGLSGVQ